MFMRLRFRFSNILLHFPPKMKPALKNEWKLKRQKTQNKGPMREFTRICSRSVYVALGFAGMAVLVLLVSGGVKIFPEEW